jgi:hypothetical protein
VHTGRGHRATGAFAAVLEVLSFELFVEVVGEALIGAPLCVCLVCLLGPRAG